MAKVIITLKIMPNSPDANLDIIKKNSEKIISLYKGKIINVEIEPIAFGLKAVKIIFNYPEEKGDTEALENKIKKVKSVSSVEIIDVGRALG